MHTFDVIGMKINIDDGWPLDQEARKNSTLFGPC